MTHRANIMLFLLLLFFAGQAAARNVHKGSIGSIQISGWRYLDEESSVIPFSRAGNLMLVHATADSVEGNFILDTGAPHLVLNLTYFRDHPSIAVDAEQTGITGVGNPVNRTTIRDFQLGNIGYQQLDADLLNLGHLENAKGVKVLGLLGVALFRNCELVIDFAENLLYIRHIRRSSASSSGARFASSTAYRTMNFELTDNRIITRLELGGKKLRFIIDCAAESNIIDSRLPDKVMETVAITGRVLLTGSGSKKLEALSGTMSGLRFGDETVAQLPVLVTNLEKTCFAYGGCIDGILGFDFISRHKIGFNFVTRKMYLWK